ncbi:MAG TPA: hypothetical protein VKA38_03685, partial [Draconibacterium sp.]|nr:hypothetical protein [Draconibacterium sp.]
IPGNDANSRSRPKDKERYPNPILINEYAWLWLNRDGSTTTLTDKVYDGAFGKNLTKEKRIYLYTRTLGMLTEYWRAHRYCAGVLHFCGLGYSRSEEPRGQTSDNFINIRNLVYEPQFVKYVKPSFAPVGLMINFWDIKVNVGAEKEIEIYAINDLYDDWSGKLKIQILKGDEAVLSQTKEITIPALEREIIKTQVEFPSEKGDYQLVAEINLDGESVKSIRDFSVE